MRSLAPKIKTKWTNPDYSHEFFYESVTTRYQRILQWMEDEKDSKAVKKHKEELFGTGSEYVYPDLYSIIGLGKELMGSYPEFQKMLKDSEQLHTVAKMIAQIRLERIVEMLMRHEGIVKRNIEKRESKRASAEQATRKGRKG